MPEEKDNGRDSNLDLGGVGRNRAIGIVLASFVWALIELWQESKTDQPDGIDSVDHKQASGWTERNRQRLDLLESQVSHHLSIYAERENAATNELQKTQGRLTKCEQGIERLRAEIGTLKDSQIAIMKQ